MTSNFNLCNAYKSDVNLLILCPRPPLKNLSFRAHWCRRSGWYDAVVWHSSGLGAFPKWPEQQTNTPDRLAALGDSDAWLHRNVISVCLQLTFVREHANGIFSLLVPIEVSSSHPRSGDPSPIFSHAPSQLGGLGCRRCRRLVIHLDRTHRVETGVR